jgi:hypothetical protein
MFEKIAEKIETAREKYKGPRRIDVGNGKELRIKFRGEEPEVKLCESGRELLDLKSLAPAGTRLEFDIKDEWHAYPAENLVKIGKFKDVGLFLTLLHEFGHLHNDFDLDLVYSAKAKYLQERTKDRVNNFDLARLTAMKEERAAVLRAERSAWAYALREVRRLERQYGLEIFGRIGDFEEIRNFVNKHLDTYEQGYLEELYHADIFTKEDMKKLFAKIEMADANKINREETAKNEIT